LAGHRCQIRYPGICSDRATIIDHIVALGLGGTNDDSNAQAARLHGPCVAAVAGPGSRRVETDRRMALGRPRNKVRPRYSCSLLGAVFRHHSAITYSTPAARLQIRSYATGNSYWVSNEQNPPMKVFISYSRLDEAAVRSMVGDLLRARVRVWLDEELGGGDVWWTAILREIRECTVFLIALSDNSLYSKPCRSELRYAQDLGLPIVPVRIGEISSYRTDPIFNQQLIDYQNPTAASGFALMGALNEHAAHRGDLPEPLPEPPPIPYEYLQRLGASIRSHAPLAPPVQAQMLFELRNALIEEEDPTVLDDIAKLLRALRRRTDVTLNRPRFYAHFLCWEGWRDAEQVRREHQGQGGAAGPRTPR
jgi:TIR domain